MTEVTASHEPEPSGAGGTKIPAGEPKHIGALRAAVNLLDREKSDPNAV